MSGKKLAKDFTKGSIPKQMFWFMLPFMASNGLQVLYSTVDMVIAMLVQPVFPQFLRAASS